MCTQEENKAGEPVGDTIEVTGGYLDRVSIDDATAESWVAELVSQED